VKHSLACVSRIGPHHEQVGFGVADQLQRFVRQGNCPVFVQLSRQLRKNEAVGYAAVVLIVVTQGARHVGPAPQVNDRVAPHIRQVLLRWTRGAFAFKPQSGAQAPVGLEVLLYLGVDRPNGSLDFLVGNLAVRMVYD
jgi:hypothetical protein